MIARWLKRNLFDSAHNAVLTVMFAAVFAWGTVRAVRFVFVTGRWEVIGANLKSLLVGFFPRPELWRVWLALFALSSALALFSAVAGRRPVARDALPPAAGLRAGRFARRAWPLALLVATFVALRPSAVIVLLVAALVAAGLLAWRVGSLVPLSATRAAYALAAAVGAAAFVLLIGFGGVGWDRWGGLMLTLFLATGGILLSFPAGVLLALGRRSSMPAVRWLSVGYIELVRGVPLVTLLFMGSFVIGLFFPPGARRPDLVTRALIAIVVFTSAYVAEIVRGGLQSVPHAQAEAGLAVGLSPLATTRFVVLPQALRAVVPALVGQFISLFKDTSLVAIIGLTELLRVAQATLAQRAFAGGQLQPEVLVFVSFVYWAFSYTMSRESQRLELGAPA